MIVPLKLILFGSNLRAIGLLGYLQLNDPLARLEEVEKGRGMRRSNMPQICELNGAGILNI